MPFIFMIRVFNEVSDQVFSGGKPTYMIGIKEQITPEVGDKLAALYEAYRDGTVNLFGVASRREGADVVL